MILKIAVLSGDGIGPEVTKQSIKVLKSLGKKFNHKIELESGLVGAVAIDKYNDPYPDETHQVCLNSDAILFGAIGDPKYDNDPKAKVRPEQGLLKMRKKLGLYANLRPTKVFESLLEMSPIKEERISGTDILFVRELTGGIYFGERGRKDNDNFAFDTCEYNRDEIIRIAKIGFEYAQKRSSKLCCVDKANVLEVSRFWRETVSDLHNKNFSSQELSHMLADNAAMQLVIDPNQFDVILASNLFGDILSDIAATLTGSIGMLPSASLNEKNVGMYEPCHGSAPDIAGKYLANPLAMILSLSMAFRYSLNLDSLADELDKAVRCLISNGARTKDIANESTFLKTSEVAKELIEILK